jgi:quinol monooxygenase YgiN
MVTRIVKMTFDEAKVEEFRTMITQNAYLIQACEGCEYLRILQDKDQPNVFFTYSYWESDAHLEMYRKSELFNKIWSFAKAGFISKPEAWSTQLVIELPE